MAKKRKATKEYRRRRGLYVPVAFLLICVVTIFAFSVFFHVSEIEVSGNVKYTAEEIIEISGIEMGDNLFLTDNSSAAANICGNMPYISEVKIERNISNKVTIVVSENVGLAYVNMGGTYWILDKDARALEETDYTGCNGKIKIKGLTPESCTVGKEICIAEADILKLTYLKETLNALYRCGIYDQVTYLDVSGIGSIKFDYAGRFTVDMGSGENAEYKIQMLVNSAEKLDAGAKGKFDLSIDKEAHFIPEQ
jgi:cell division protein FtsQ